MARINRSDVIQKAVNELGLSTASDLIPNQTLDKVQLTYDLNKKISSFLLSASSTATGTMTITLPIVSVGAEIYITGIDYGLVKDATLDQPTGRLSVLVTPDFSNLPTAICAAEILTLTAQDIHINMNLPYPLKIKNGTSITNVATTTVGNISRTLSIMGYITSSN